MSIPVDWSGMLEWSVSPLEIFLRGTLTYWFIFIVMRVVGRRDTGSLGMADLLVLVLIADAAQNAMAGEYKAVPDGMVLILTIVLWSVVIDRLAYWSPLARRILQPAELCLIRNGQVQRRALRREGLTMDDLMSELRQKGVDDTSVVKVAYIEPDGSVSVVRRDA